MMKLNKNSVSNNTSDLPDKGILAAGSDLYTQEMGRYLILDIQTMINAPTPEQMQGGCVLMVNDYDEEMSKIKGLELWNAFGVYAFSGTQDSSPISGWNIVGGSGGGGHEVGDFYGFHGKLEDIKHLGEYHNLATTKVFTEEEHPEFVAQNRDSLEGADALNLLSYSPSAYTFTSYPENFKYWDNQMYYIGLTPSYVAIRSGIQTVETDKLCRGIKISSGFGSYFKTPGIKADDGNGVNSISYCFNAISPFEVKNVILADGTVCDGFVSLACSRRASSSYAVNVKRTDLFLEDLSDFVPDTTEETQSNEANSIVSSLANKQISYALFFEDGFYVLSEEDDLRKYSYDFTGGTFKSISYQGTFNTSINNNSDKARSTAIGNLTENIYQLDMSNGDLLINNSVVNNLIFTDDISNARFGVGYVSLVVNEYQNKIYIAAHLQNDNGEKAIQGWSYFDGISWNNFIVPEPSNLNSTFSRSMIMCKVDLSTGLFVANIQNENASEDYNNNSEVNLKFVYSKDYGNTWGDDSGITNSPSTIIPENKMPIGRIEETMISELGSNTFVFNNLYPNCVAMSKTKRFSQGDSEFYVGTESGGYKIEYIYDVPLTTSTIIGQIPNNPKINEFVKVSNRQNIN